MPTGSHTESGLINKRMEKHETSSHSEPILSKTGLDSETPFSSHEPKHEPQLHSNFEAYGLFDPVKIEKDVDKSLHKEHLWQLESYVPIRALYTFKKPIDELQVMRIGPKVFLLSKDFELCFDNDVSIRIKTG